MDQTTADAIVEARLIAAVRAVRSIPGCGEDPQVDVKAWPDYVTATLQSAFEDQTARRIAPTEGELADMREAIKWLGYVDPLEGELIWLRADGQPWRYASQKTGCVRPKAWARWKAAIAKIARRAKLKTSTRAPRAKVQPAPSPDQTMGQGQGSGLGNGGADTLSTQAAILPPDLRTPILQGGAGATGGV